MAHWKIWGHSFTCSECNNCTNPGNYCDICGAEMNEPEEYWCPPLPKIKPIKIGECPKCGKTIVGIRNYCPHCGVRIDEVME